METGQDFKIVHIEEKGWVNEDGTNGHRPAFHLVPKSKRACRWLAEAAKNQDKTLRIVSSPHQSIQLSRLGKEKGPLAIRAGKTYTALSMSMLRRACTNRLAELAKQFGWGF